MKEKQRWIERVGYGVPMLIGTAMTVATSIVAQEHPLPASPEARPSAAVAAQNTVTTSRSAEAILARVIDPRLNAVTLKEAIRTLGTRAGVLIVYRGDDVAKYAGRVTVRKARLTLGEALEQVLRPAGLTVVSTPDGNLVVTESAGTIDGVIAGGITGRVVSTNGHPVRGATVILDDATRGVTTDDDGAFALKGVSAGPHRVTVRLLGYNKQTKSVTVSDGATSEIAFTLTVSANQLDQVVVTGTVIPSELKAVPNAITVITAKELEQRGITRIDQLFHGDVPGLFAGNVGSGSLLGQVIMFSRGSATLPEPAGQFTPSRNPPIKTYVDGVELADPSYLNQIDPRSIERIEILTGPQASTIYGSNAINGVMQVFTKRGSTTRPTLVLNLSSGLIQNNYSRALAPEHDYSAQVSGLEGRVSYNAGMTWTHTGPWSPATKATTVGAYGGVRMEFTTPLGRIAADATFRRANTQDLQRGEQLELVAYYRQTGWFAPCRDCNSGLVPPTSWSLAGQTMGLTFNYAPTSWWSHELGLGQDTDDQLIDYVKPSYKTVTDTGLYYDQTQSTRRSIRYATTLTVPVTSFSNATVTVGADTRQELSVSLYALPQSLTGTLTNTSAYTSIQRQPGHNTGGFVQAQLGLLDQLFFTYGLRAEWNPTYGAAAEPNYAPRYGMALTEDFGTITAKLRASYGRSTRPPAASLRRGHTERDAEAIRVYGPHDNRIANPTLAPEFQQGGEAGLEVYMGQRVSFVVTRYNQTVDGLITEIPRADSIRSLMPNPTFGGYPCSDWIGINYLSYCSSQDAQGYGYAAQSQNANVGSIRNQGWEFQGSVTTGPLTTKATYSWTKSRMIGITEKYRAQFPLSRYPQYHPGATFGYFPEHTFALGFTYALAGTTVALNLNETGQLMNLGDAFSIRNLDGNIRLDQNRLTNVGWPYISFNHPYMLADLNATHRLSSTIDAVLQIQNLANHYTNDYFGASAVMGRQTKGGFRIRL